MIHTNASAVTDVTFGAVTVAGALYASTRSADACAAVIAVGQVRIDAVTVINAVFVECFADAVFAFVARFAIQFG